MLIADTALSMAIKTRTEMPIETVSVEDTIRLTDSTLAIVAGKFENTLNQRGGNDRLFDFLGTNIRRLHRFPQIIFNSCYSHYQQSGH